MANAIILNSGGNDQYGFMGRGWASNPIKCSHLNFFLSESIQVSVDNGDPTAGDGTLKVYVWYSILTL
jgi:hypothetical protein